MKIVQIKEFCSTGSGGTPSRRNASFYDNGNIPWIKSGELKNNYVTSATEFITQEAINGSSAKLIQPNSLLVAMYGATVGEASILAIEAATNQAVCNIQPNMEMCDLRYLYRYFQHIKPSLIKKSVGGGQPNISQGVIRSLKIPLPQLEEQKRIAAILDDVDESIRLRKESIKALDDLIQSTFISMFGDPVTNPMGWEIGKLGAHSSKIGSGSTPRGGDKSYKTEGIPLVRSLNVHNGEFKYKRLALIDDDQAERLKNVILMKNDVLLNITGASVARVCRVPKSVSGGRVNQHVAIIRPTEKIMPLYLERLLLNDHMKAELIGIGESGGATRQAITKDQILKIKVPIPSLEKQQEFTSAVQTIEEQKSLYQAQLTELENYFSCLQQKAFKGEL